MISEEEANKNRQERFDRVMNQVYTWWWDENFESSDLDEKEIENVFSEIIPTMTEMIELQKEEIKRLKRESMTSRSYVFGQLRFAIDTCPEPELKAHLEELASDIHDSLVGESA